MAIAASAYWRVRPSGNDANGGGYDASASSAATGSHGSWATSSGATTFTDATAGAFTTGMVNAAIEIAGVGQFKILTRVDANNITITTMPPWLSANSNFGSAANWTVGSGTDYSQQDSPQVTFNGTTITATTAGVGATITITGYTVAATDVCNVLHITGGTNFTTGWYTIASVNTGTGTWTLDRNCTTGAGSGMTGRMGGGWATLNTNPASSSINVPGNKTYVLGGASPSYVSPDYTVTAFDLPGGSSTNGRILFGGDPSTPTTNGYGGWPLIKCPNSFASNTGPLVSYANLFLFCSANVSALFTGSGAGAASVGLSNIILDQNGYDSGLNSNFAGADFDIQNVEIFSSAAKRTTNTVVAINCGGATGGTKINFCNIHDCIGPGAAVYTLASLRFTIIAKNGADGVSASNNGVGFAEIKNCTIDGNAGNGIVFTTANALTSTEVNNCIISNHTTAGKFAITVSAGTQAANDRIKNIVDYNTLYNNAGNYNAISPGAHDTVLSSDPYVGQSTENYTLA